MHDAILERERAHTRTLPRVRQPVRTDRGCPFGEWPLLARLGRRRVHRAEVVLATAGPLLLLRLRHLEVVVEVTAERRRPREAPSHPALVRLQLRERGSRDDTEVDVVVREVDGKAVEAVRDRRTGGTARCVIGPEHEVIDEELRTPSEEICERRASLVGLESVLLLDRDPGQLAPPPRKLVAEPGVVLFADEELLACGEPFFTCSDLVIRHRAASFCVVSYSSWRCHQAPGGSSPSSLRPSGARSRIRRVPISCSTPRSYVE